MANDHPADVTARYFPRVIDQRLSDLFSQFAAVKVTGPRAVGKTRTAGRLAANLVNLADKQTHKVFTADPRAALKEVDEPVLLDEWQLVPGLPAAVKWEVDQNTRPGRFLLTGSVSPDSLAEQWPFVGRVISLAMEPMCGREVVGHVGGQPFIDRIVMAHPEALEAPSMRWAGALDLGDYLRLAIVGGLPESVWAPSDQRRADWLMASYAEELLAQEARWLREAPDPSRFRRYLRAQALFSSRVVTDSTLYQAAGINRETARRYDQLLERLFVTGNVPAWSMNRLKRLVRAPKRFLRDPAMMAATLGVDMNGLMRDGQLVGQLLETFVAAQIRAELAGGLLSPHLYHLRNGNGDREVDLILEYPNGDVVGIEVKAGGVVSSGDTKHLRWLRDELGDQFVCGVVLHTGFMTRLLDDRIIAAPISTLWAWDPDQVDGEVYQMDQARTRAFGMTTADGDFLVFAGSRGLRRTPFTVEPSQLGQRIKGWRADLQQRGVIDNVDDLRFVFRRNWVFDSPGPPTELLLGAAPSEPSPWTSVKTGQPLGG